MTEQSCVQLAFPMIPAGKPDDYGLMNVTVNKSLTHVHQHCTNSEWRDPF
jgi:hypothetical protein